METNSIIERFEELITRGNNIIKKIPEYGLLENETFSEFVTWRLSSKNLLRQVYGQSFEHYELFSNRFSKYSEEYRGQCSKEHLQYAIGILRSAKEEFDLGFNHKIEHIISIEFFDSVLEQAKELVKKGHKDPAAVLGRIIIENSLKDICKRKRSF